MQLRAVLAAQGGRCAVGGEPLGPQYVADHCHLCAEGHGHAPERGCPRCFRGLVCMPHNTALGLFGDDVDGLVRAARYAGHGAHG